MAKKKTKKARKKLSPQEKAHRNDKIQQRKEVSTILKNIGFSRLPFIDGKEITFDGRTSEMDDIFIYENIILLTEYTVGNPGDHLKNKIHFYNKVNQDKNAFIDFLLAEPKLNSFSDYYTQNIKGKYSKNQLKIKILYCSKKTISQEHRDLADGVVFFDYYIVKYFQSLTKIIKRTSKYEFFDFLDMPMEDVGDNIKNSSYGSSNRFEGQILPEEKSSFKEGYKIVSFYIDAESLLRRAYVLRQSSWRNTENIGHYQRMFSSPKIASMRKYLIERNRVFINNIISSVDTNEIRLYDSNKNLLTLDKNGQFVGENSTKVTPAIIEINDECNIIGIIDGQHRIYSYHEGDDQYETKIAELRKIQNLLVTGILFPSKESEEKKLKFEANLFLEINSNQTKANPKLTQEIEAMISPFSMVAIAKRILKGLDKSGPLGNQIEQYDYEKGKIKTPSIVSYGLRPLIKIEDTKVKDSIFVIWQNPEKDKLKAKDNEEHELLKEYIDFAVEKIRDLLIGFKTNLSQDQWNTYSPSNPKGVLTVTFVNGVLNVLRLLIENNKVTTAENYKEKLKRRENFDFKKYRSSQYRKLGEDIYREYFK